MRTSLLLATSAAVAISATAVGSPCLAQANPSGTTAGLDQAKSDPAAVDQVEDIVVTAQRRSENLQQVPIAVTALTAARLESTGVVSTATLTSVTPSLTFSSIGGYLTPRIRGIGNASTGPGVENAVSTYVDGVYFASSPGSLLSLGNVDRVEVLNGPQGTLFGRNATGGVIQIVTKDPAAAFRGDAKLSIDNYKNLEGDIYITGPISGAVLADLALTLRHQFDGYGTNLATGNPTYQVRRDIEARSKWLFDLGTRTTVRLSFDLESLGGSDPTITQLEGTVAPANKTPAGAYVLPHLYPWDTNAYFDANHEVFARGASIRVDQKIGSLNVESVTAYRATDFHQFTDTNVSPNVPLHQIYHERDRQTTEELQLSPVRSDRFNWVLGFYYFNLDAGYDPFQSITGAPGAYAYPTNIQDDLTVRSYAAFGQGTLKLWSGTNLTLGARYTIEDRTIDGTSGSITAAGVSTVTASRQGKVSSSTPTWRVSLDHQFQEGVMGYVSYNRGYKSGGFNPQVITAPAYAPETLDAYEIGVKSTLLGRRLRLNTAIFLYDYRNLQVNTYLGALGVIYNGAKARTYGADLDLEYEVAHGLRLTGGFDLLHDRFTSFPLAVISTLQPTGLITQAPGSATGNRLPYAPDATVQFGFSYTRDLPHGSVTLTLNDLYNNGFFTQPDNFEHQGSYHMVNGSLTWRPGGDSSISIFANNILQVKAAEYKVALTTFQGVSYQPPRVVGVRIRKGF